MSFVLAILPPRFQQVLEAFTGLSGGGPVTGGAQGEADEDLGDLLGVDPLALDEPDPHRPVGACPVGPAVIGTDHQLIRLLVGLGRLVVGGCLGAEGSVEPCLGVPPAGEVVVDEGHEVCIPVGDHLLLYRLGSVVAGPDGRPAATAPFDAD